MFDLGHTSPDKRDNVSFSDGLDTGLSWREHDIRSRVLIPRRSETWCQQRWGHTVCRQKRTGVNHSRFNTNDSCIDDLWVFKEESLELGRGDLCTAHFYQLL